MAKYSDDCEQRNQSWRITDVNGNITELGMVSALLTDIRRELARIRAVAECPNCTAIPKKLDQIIKNTNKRRRKK